MKSKTRVMERTEATKVAKSNKIQKSAASVPPKKDHVLFVSAEPEVMQFPITVVGEKINALWDNEHEHLVWKVPNKLVERFSMHEHVVKGRIVREGD